MPSLNNAVPVMPSASKSPNIPTVSLFSIATCNRDIADCIFGSNMGSCNRLLSCFKKSSAEVLLVMPRLCNNWACRAENGNSSSASAFEIRGDMSQVL